MPKVRSKRVAQRVRKNSVPGKNKSEQGLPGSRRTKTPDPTVIANSVFALTLSKKSGYEIEFKSSDEKLPVRIQDMIKIYKKVTGKDIILKPGLSHAEIFELVVKRLKNFLPNNYSIFLNGETEKTELIIYQACEYANWLPGFQIELAVPKLKKHPALFDLFLQFIRSFSLYSGCEMWYNGIFDACVERTEEMMDGEEGYFDPEIAA
ncbi:MAG: hypothetical protein EOO01_33280, partial [Chitinophagaceae bacterium]